MNIFLENVTSWLKQESGLELVLRETMKQFDAQTGTIHRLDEKTQLLHLVVQVGLPPQLMDIIKTIPVGKGIAGQTVSENRPVTICNLQTDASGVAKPGAKQTGVGGALCVPIRKRGEIIGTFGVGTIREHEYTAAEINRLLDISAIVGESLP